MTFADLGIELTGFRIIVFCDMDPLATWSTRPCGFENDSLTTGEIIGSEVIESIDSLASSSIIDSLTSFGVGSFDSVSMDSFATEMIDSSATETTKSSVSNITSLFTFGIDLTSGFSTALETEDKLNLRVFVDDDADKLLIESLKTKGDMTVVDVVVDSVVVDVESDVDADVVDIVDVA